MGGRAPRLFAAAGILLSIVAGWALSRPLSEVQQIRRHFADLRRQVDAARQSSGARAAAAARNRNTIPKTCIAQFQGSR